MRSHHLTRPSIISAKDLSTLTYTACSVWNRAPLHAGTAKTSPYHCSSSAVCTHDRRWKKQDCLSTKKQALTCIDRFGFTTVTKWFWIVGKPMQFDWTWAERSKQLQQHAMVLSTGFCILCNESSGTCKIKWLVTSPIGGLDSCSCWTFAWVTWSTWWAMSKHGGKHSRKDALVRWGPVLWNYYEECLVTTLTSNSNWMNSLRRLQ